MMQKFSLTKRPAETGGSINTRTEMHGKEKVPAHDIKIGKAMASAAIRRDVTRPQLSGCASSRTSAARGMRPSRTSPRSGISARSIGTAATAASTTLIGTTSRSR